MTIKQAVIEELLDAVDDPAVLERIFRRYSRSKGPFYLGLAEATCRLESRFHKARQTALEAECQNHNIQGKLDSLEEQRDGLEDHIQAVSRQVEAKEERLGEVQGVLDLAVDLERRGFGLEELNRLYKLLAQIAADQGALPEESVAQFFETVSRYEHIVSLDLETTRAESRAAQAKAEAERWEAEADARMVQSKARIGVIDLVEDLLAKGVKADDFVGWAAIIDRAVVSVEELAESLEEYSSIQALSADRQRRAEEIQTEITGLEAQVLALAQERDNAHSAIVAVRDKALKTVRAAESQAKQQVDSLFRDAVELGRAREEATALGKWIEAAQLLQSGDPESWKQLPLEVIQHMVLVTLRWSEAEGRDLQMSFRPTSREGPCSLHGPSSGFLKCSSGR